MSQFYRQLATLTPEQRALFEKKLAQKGLDKKLGQKLGSGAIQPCAKDQPIPLSFAQQRLWFVQQLDPTTTAYNVASVLELTGALDAVALEKSLNALVERHETFRTRFELDSQQPVQVIEPPKSIHLQQENLSPAADSQTVADQRIQAVTQAPFDLAKPLLRTALLKVAENRHLFVLATHHIISDRWSVMVFLREMTILYRAFSQGQSSPLPPLPIQYADWAVWQRQQLQGEKLDQQTNYWKDQLSGELPVLDLPLDRPYEAVATYSGAQVPLALPLALSTKLKALSAQQNVTLFTLLLTALKVLLHHYTGSEDIVVGSDIANRDRTETEGLIGLLVNTLVFRSDLSNNPRFCDLLQQVRETVLGGLAHKELPFEKLIEVINPERHLSQMMPLFQVKLDLQQVDVRPMQMDGLTIVRYPLPETQAKYELRLNLQDTESGIAGQVEYNKDLFDESTIVRMVFHFQTLLSGLVDNLEARLSELPLLSEKEQQTLLVDWNQTHQPYPTNVCIHQLFEAQVEKTPNAIALSNPLANDRTAYTYTELNRKANQLAHHLRELGIGNVQSTQTIGICMTRSCEMVISMLAVLKAGGTYVPLDIAYPAERLSFIAEDAQLQVLLTQGEEVTFEVTQSLKVVDITAIENDSARTENMASASTPESLAYVIYTSGSTGRPKGVAIEHRSTVSFLHWTKQQFSATELSGVLASTSICFDLSVFEIFAPLSWGGRVIVVENVLAIPNLPTAANISLLNTVPSVLTHLLKVAKLPTSIQTVNLAGESLPVSLVEQLHNLSHIQHVYNLYGPSEDTTYSTCAPLHKHQFSTNEHRVPIGKPIANTQAFVLDRYQQPAPVGISGELYLSGSGLAQGYLNQSALTAERFIEQSTLGERLYKTGDRVRYRPDGALEFLGRFDHQIKIRGFRIETGEIETALRQHSAIQDVVVVAHSPMENQTEKQLVAYVVTDLESPQIALRKDLAQRLPDYLIPTVWITLDSLPQLPNGKIDRRALPVTTQLSSSQTYVAPSSPKEKTLANIWCSVLSQEKVGIHDNFFELGGHSLLAIQIVAQAEDALQTKIPLRAFFQSPTVAGLIATIEENTSDSQDFTQDVTHKQRIEIDLAHRHEPFPLTDIQQAYWLGRSQAFDLGNIGTHGYREIEVMGLSVPDAEAALNKLIKRHDMLRAVVNTDGQQMILPEVSEYRVQVTDISESSAQKQQIRQIRDHLSHQIFKPEQWPLFHIEAARLPSNKIRFFVSFDVLIGDAWSFQLLGREMAMLIMGQSLPPLSLSFRDYVMAEQAFRKTPAYEKSLQYWQSRLATLPSAPSLPLTMAPSQVIAPRFERRSGQLEAAEWARLKQLANKASLTPSGVVLAAFAEVLTTWSQSPQFTLNLTLFNRLPLHPEVNQIIGDFTASLLLAIDNSGTDSFTGRAQRLQNQLWDDLEHRAVSGVQVLRELAKLPQNGGGTKGRGALMPVVFTSTLNQAIPKKEQNIWQSETVYSVSQTSQVYLDHQVSEIEGALVFNWDAIADLFPAGLLDQMFTAYTQLLHQLATDETIWHGLPQLAPTNHVRELNSGGHAPFEKGDRLLHELFFEQAQQQPDQIAVITSEKSLTYAQLADQSLQLSRQLQQLGVRPNQLVAVSMPKGWQQVIAVLGILSSGAAYVPIDPALPRDRRWQLIADTAAEIVLTTDSSILDWPTGLTQICVGERFNADTTEAETTLVPKRIQSSTDLAYVIYTSGSTGMPKGVMLDHQSVVNTLLDINQRFEVTQRDRVFVLSSLSFDLSVYDIFGTLAAGATLIIPTAEQIQNPTHWRHLITAHQVTIWNSVPALMQLLTTELADSNQTHDALRLVTLSGDWIPLTLPEQIQKHAPMAQVVSLGGATEAAIWSIAYPIESVDSSWRSIPYGKPLANQEWYVLDENLNPCPCWVPGQLYIGGIGLAKGYWNQPELTSEQFVDHRQRGRLYRTGDLGRYHPDGTLEFLGREDFQIKVNGYRIELGEIESALQQYPAIETAVVEAVGTPPELVAYVVPALKKGTDAIAQPLSKLDFKQKQIGIRKDEAESQRVLLPQPNATESDYLQRQSHRQFLTNPVETNHFSDFLSVLGARPLVNAPLPKYRYASAGSLYPIQTYLHVCTNRITDVEAGWYYYHPVEHCLVKLSSEENDEDNELLYGPNYSLSEDSAFSLFLVANLDAIEPIYGDKARDFCLIETGYMGQLMMEKASSFELGLCPIGGFNAAALQQQLTLGQQHQPLHALIGGAIDPAWNQQWQAVSQPAQTVSIKETLRQHLSEKLPGYMVPARYQILENLPLTANGKVDRRSLPIPDFNEVEYVAPTSPTEKTIAELWKTVLEVEKVGIHDNFFELGGNSLTAMQLLSKLQNAFSTTLTIAQLFSALTPEKQAKLVDQSLSSQPSRAKADVIPRRQASADTPSVDISSIDALSDDDVDDLLTQLLNEQNQEVGS
ncbi:amino acid adenylation domain-containing protein [cf. Phormidesmis sp. LEGE 11477]|nr:non-ribosomal peptide synthetase [cf. Phormidesmis sp. LEGE 11477]MBE9060864.1 amino acid adenylation domain-containing protein [cf. Phormidesmis sp. LEGE 11477]